MSVKFLKFISAQRAAKLKSTNALFTLLSLFNPPTPEMPQSPPGKLNTFTQIPVRARRGSGHWQVSLRSCRQLNRRLCGERKSLRPARPGKFDPKSGSGIKVRIKEGTNKKKNVNCNKITKVKRGQRKQAEGSCQSCVWDGARTF